MSTTRKTYNGHASRNAWNVALWINNDEGLYRRARFYCRRFNRRAAAAGMLDELTECGVTHTPDGVRYTVTNIRRAMEGI